MNSVCSSGVRGSIYAIASTIDTISGTIDAVAGAVHLNGTLRGVHG